MLLGTIRARMLPLWIKLKMWTNPRLLKTRGIQAIRGFLYKLLDVRPRDQKDYYPVLRWLVSKRLAFALVVGLGICAALFLTTVLPEGFLGGTGERIPTYRYRSIPLKFHSGNVKIEAKGGYIAYDGAVDKGAANGKGTLYNKAGGTVYEGDFKDNRYNGKGTCYYPGGTPQYQGDFTDNMFHGTGSYYRSNGVLEYEGDYHFNARTGEGILYNGVGSQVYQGNFLNDFIVYSDFVDRPTSEVSTLYSGDTDVYQSDREICTTMPEIQAVYSVRDGSKTLENEWTVDQILVLQDQVQLDGGVCTEIGQIKQQLGEPLYFGTAWVNLSEAVAWNLMAHKLPDRLPPVEIQADSPLENVHNVTSYNSDTQVYLYTFEQNELLYTFYFTEAGQSHFFMYAIEKA